MWTDYAFRHPVELIILNVAIAAPFAFAAFGLAARAAKRDRSWTARLLDIAAVLVLWGVVTLVQRTFALYVRQQPGGPSEVLVADGTTIVVAAIGATALSLLRRSGSRAAASALFLVLVVTLVEGFPFGPGYGYLEPGMRAVVWLTVAFGVGLAAAGSYFMHSPSHTARAGAALAGCWGTELTAYGVLGATTGYDHVMRSSRGLVTTDLVWAVTGLVLGACLVAACEQRRLRRRDGRSAALAVSERRMRVLANATSEGLVIHRGGTVIDANDRFRAMIGGDDPRGRPLSELLRDGESPCLGGEGECLLRPDGRRLPVETLCRSLDDERLVTAVRDMTQNCEDQARIRELAANDALTGLLNRRSFDDALAARVGGLADRMPSCLAILMIDLDRFKPINDTYGHAAGDALLRALAERFAETVRPGDAVARLGGDEFAVLAWVPDERAAARLAERVREVAGQPVEIDGVEASVGASVGFALAPRDGDDEEALRQASDIALYASKHGGRDRVTAFEPAMAERANDRHRLEADLRLALERGEIALHYQVQHDIKAGRAIGYEALMRWHHPERGMVPPGEFIPIAEETGLIVPLGRWAIEHAARDFAGFDDRTRVSVNVSPVQFERGDLIGDVRHALAVSGLPAHRLEIEVTEQLLLADTEGTLAQLEALRATGVTLSLDDFGSGYSSLAYLTRFPFSKIKIDRQFVDRMASDRRSHALVRSILALASSLGLRVTAEGVETHGQLASLATGRCDEAQGYLLGRPVPFEELQALDAAARESLVAEAS